MSENEKELLIKFLNWLYDGGLEKLNARFEGIPRTIEYVIDKFEKYIKHSGEVGTQ